MIDGAGHRLWTISALVLQDVEVDSLSVAALPPRLLLGG